MEIKNKGKYSKEKGKRGERLFVSLCKENGYDNVHRTAQFMGKTGNAGDVEGLDGIHIEVKFVERLNVRDAMEQAKRDSDAANDGSLPIVAHKTSNSEWLVTMTASDWFKMYREYNGE